MSDRADKLRQAAEIIRTAKVSDPLLFDLRDAVMKMADWVDSYESEAGSQAKRIAELEAERDALKVDAGRLLDNDAVIDAVAWTLCLQDGNDEESAHTLIWQGQPPEPYGEVWCTYAGKAREVLKEIYAAIKEQQ